MTPLGTRQPAKRTGLQAAALLGGLLPALPALAQPPFPPAAIPALRACLAGDTAAFALAPEAQADGGLRVPVWRSGAAEACHVAADGRVERQTLPGAAPPDPAAPAFFLERRCVDARRLDGPDGAVLGWVAYPSC